MYVQRTRAEQSCLIWCVPVVGHGSLMLKLMRIYCCFVYTRVDRSRQIDGTSPETRLYIDFDHMSPAQFSSELLKQQRSSVHAEHDAHNIREKVQSVDSYVRAYITPIYLSIFLIKPPTIYEYDDTADANCCVVVVLLLLLG